MRYSSFSITIDTWIFKSRVGGTFKDYWNVPTPDTLQEENGANDD
jgi:hypothetical protein